MTSSKALLPAACWLALLSVLSVAPVHGGDWPEWGGDPSKNMVAPVSGLPAEFTPGEEADGEVDPATATNLKWVAKLGSEGYGTATIANGRVLAGTNNERPRNPKIEGDRGVVMAFDERRGTFQWQLTVPKLPGGDDLDWEYLGICSSTLMAGDRGYVVTNRCEVVCLDLKGLGDGNDGFAEEGKFMAGPGKQPAEVGPTDADIVWVYDMMKGVGAVPHNIASSSVALVDGVIFASTSNGVDGTHEETPAPEAPCLIALDAKSGRLLAKEESGISKRMFHCNWSSPSVGELDGRPVVFFGGGDGSLYAFDAAVAKDAEEPAALEELWRYDANAKEYRVDDDGEPRNYPSFKGPSEVIGTPVIADGKVFVTIGQDPENGDGVGMLSCVDAKSGKAVWTSKEVSRSLSTPAVANGLVYISDFSGQVHCLDAATGEKVWTHDAFSRIWGSTLVADGRLYVGTEDGELIILKAGRELEELGTVAFPASIYAAPVAANGTLYIQTRSRLYAFGELEDGRPARPVSPVRSDP